MMITAPREESTNEAARAGVPLNAANVRWILAKIEAEVKTEKKRRWQADFFAKNARNITDEARAIYASYAKGASLA